MLIKESMIDQRAEEACYADFHNSKYEKLMSKSCVIRKRLEKMACKKRREEFFKLWEDEFELVEHQKHLIELKLSYKQCFMDGLEIAKLLLKHKK